VKSPLVAPRLITSVVLAALATLAMSLSARVAFAQAEGVDRNPGDRHESSAPPPSLPEPPPVAPGEPPLSQTGFQVAFRTGAAIPAAKVSQGDGNSMGDVFAPQVPLLVELGAKPIEELFVGVYAGFGLGGVASSFEQQCNAAAVSCSTHTLRVGIEGIVHLLPARRLDPWIGYGIGLESSTVSAEANKSFATSGVSGLELAHLMAGMDVRLSHYFGIGPYADVAIGRYTSIHEDGTLTMPANDSDIAHPAAHLWVTLGARVVVFP
jgi:hypothetical protein